MRLSQHDTVTAKTERLGETLVDAHYLALELRHLALDTSFFDHRASELLADLLYAWAKRLSERLEAGRPCFRELQLAPKREENSSTSHDTERAPGRKKPQKPVWRDGC